MLVNLSQYQIDKIKSLVRGELGYLQDNRYRYQSALDYSKNKNLKTGNDVPFTEVIADHDKDIEFLNSIISALEK